AEMDLAQLVHQLGPHGRAAVAEQLGANAGLRCAWAAPQTCQNIFPVESQLQRLGNFSPQSCGARVTASFFKWTVGFPACTRGTPFSISPPTGPSYQSALCIF